MSLGVDENILSKAIEHFGKDSQRTVAIEELSELIKELCKDARGLGSKDRIAEEISDVYIMLCQLMLMYDINDEVVNWISIKTVKLHDRLKLLRAI